MISDFFSKFRQAVTKNDSLLCVGLDPVLDKLPAHLQSVAAPFFEFNKAIIDATADLVCAYKPNSAFYEALGEAGEVQLRQTIEYIDTNYPHIPVILDAKRGDIGNTNDGYATAAFDHLKADAITLHPYLGHEALAPFLDRKDKGQIILCRTSNPGAGEFQDLLIDGMPLYQHVARQVSEVWNTNGNCLLVVGATYPEEMATVRQIVGSDMIFLVPGIGAQGGDITAVMQAGRGEGIDNLIINSARDIIYASSGEDFATAARDRAESTRNNINQYR